MRLARSFATTAVVETSKRTVKGMDDAEVQEARMPMPGDEVGRYRLTHELGRGGMAVVMAGLERSLERPVACKILLPHLRSDPQMRALFQAEARLLGQISHPGVVTLLDAGEAQGSPYIAMELLEGETLEALAPEAGLDRGAALAILVQVADALAAVHQARGIDGEPLAVVHRDVSPQNVHVGRDGVVKLLDFGIAASRERHRFTRTGELRGKLQYLAPEQITRSQPVTAQADLWALGVLARELLTGKPLFRGDSEATTLWNVTAALVPPLAAEGLGLSPELCEILDRCLQRDPAARPGSPREVAEGLRAALRDDARERVRAFMRTRDPARGSGEKQAHARRPARATPRSPRRWRHLGATVSLGVLGALLLLSLTSAGGEAPGRKQREAVAEPVAQAPSPPPAAHEPPSSAGVADQVAKEPAAQPPARGPRAAARAKAQSARWARDAERPQSPLLANPY